MVQAKPKSVYEDDQVKALWDVPLFAEINDKKKEKVILIEMSCPWIDNRVVKAEEKTRKYGPL